MKVVTRAPFGKMLATVPGRSLYFTPSNACSGPCLGVWPPLFMPTGKTIPLGAKCLGTIKVGRKLQVTYREFKLFTFVSDSGSSVNGNGVGGFKVAKLLTSPCPA